MKPPVRQRESEPDSKPQRHPGFTEHGVYFTSEVTVTNHYTLWVWSMCKRIRAELLTPGMVMLDVLKSEPWVGRLFKPLTVTTWFELDRFHLWPIAGSDSQLERTLMQQGRETPPWNDDYAWTRACDMAETMHGHPSRFQGVDMADPGSMLRGLVHTVGGLEASAFDARMQAESERQLQAAKAVGLL